MHTRSVPLLGALTLAAVLAGGSCSDDVPSDQAGSSSVAATAGSSGSSGAGGGDGAGGAGGAGGSAPDCVTNPTTHVEIINACTDAQAIDKAPELPLLGPNGELPPLP